MDRPPSARLLGETLNQPSDERRATRPIARVVRPADVAGLAVHVMANQSLAGAVFAVDGGKDSSSTFDGW